jgi:hypothetical protein
MRKHTGQKVIVTLLALVGGLQGALGSAPAASQEETVALELATLLRSGREVISHHQKLIDEQRAGKELTAKKITEQIKANYAHATAHPFPALDETTLEGKLLQAELGAMHEVVDQAQAVINDTTRGFKGFLPAVFAYRVADRFDQKVGDVAYLKLTAPVELIRHRGNSPDAWEERMIKTKLQSPDWPKGKAVAEEAELNAKKAYRLLIPEYYQASCLACHGEPKGATDITGGKKEGRKLGDLGGAISAAIYLQ